MNVAQTSPSPTSAAKRKSITNKTSSNLLQAQNINQFTDNQSVSQGISEIGNMREK